MIAIDLEVPGAVVINTRFLEQAQARWEFIVRNNRIGLFYGLSGCGKTTAAQAAQACYPGACSISLQEPTPKSIANDTLSELTGVQHWEQRARASVLLIERILDAPPPLLVYDELHLSRSVQNIEFIRGLHMRVRIPILLVGDQSVIARLRKSAQIMRRIYRPCWFGALTRADILDLIPQWHPIYANADPSVIDFIDDKHADGNLGNWSKLTLGAIEECQREGVDTITQRIAEKVISLEPFRAPGARA